jgi:DNA-binding NarL/FixJ family response regulator
VLAAEPRPELLLTGARIDRALAAMGHFADLISPFPAGHSAGVATLAEAAGRRCGIDATALRRAGLVHDLGRVAIPPRVSQKPASLTADEVVAMLARGLRTKQVARALGISVKTADRHVQNAYRKIGVSSRAAATLFAMEHGLVAWGEFPMARPPARS